MRTPIPKWISKKYGRYAPQAYACISRKGRSLKKSWDCYREDKEALNGGKQLKIDI